LDQVHNEQTKLLANALNTGGTSCFTVGVLAPNRSGSVYVERTIDFRSHRGSCGGCLVFCRGRITFASETCFAEPASMTELQIFAFVILPVVVVALGWGAVVLNEHFNSPHHPAGE
jgi:hypothetical protein